MFTSSTKKKSLRPLLTLYKSGGAATIAATTRSVLMEIDRRAFMANLGAAAAALRLMESPAFTLPLVQQAPPAGFDRRALRARANADGEFLLKARYWDAHLRVEIGDHPYDVLVQAGKVVDFAPAVAAGSPDVRIAGPAQVWATSFALRGLTIEGDPIRQTAPYRGAIMRLVTLVREALNGPMSAKPVKDVDRQFDTA